MLAKLLRTLRLGFKSLMLHKLRSGLAMLGILIGVTAVIWLVAMGEGVSYQAQQQIKDLGATNIIVKSVKPPMSSSRGGGGSFVVEYGLTRDDYDRIVTNIPTVRRAVPMREIKSEVRYSTRLADVQLLGCTPEYFEINHLSMERGRFLEDNDLIARDNVAVIASETAARLFPYEDPIGKSLQVLVNNSVHLFRIIGQTAGRTPSASIGGSLEGRNYNLDVYVPLSTFRARIGDQVFTARSGSREGELIQLSQITVTVADIEQVEEAADIIGILLRKYHKDADYSVTVPKELLRQAETMRMMFNVLLALIAGISLIVGGIGIMNIMLATVTERTREIGIRRALGATRHDIVRQFIAETVVLTAVGGMLGIAFGFLCPAAVQSLQYALSRTDIWESLPETMQTLEPRIAPWSVMVSFAISVSVGVIFGLYPAFRAARMDPIEALRHE